MSSIRLGHYGLWDHFNFWPFNRWPLRRWFSARVKELQAHAHIVGKSGSGKSSYLAYLYAELVKRGQSVTLIDPHGDLPEQILTLLVEDGYFADPQNLDRFIYLDIPRAATEGRYLPFNVFAQHAQPHEIASHFKDAMHRAFPELSEGAAIFDTLLPRTVKVLMYHGLHLTDMEDFLYDEKYRESLLEDYPEPQVVSYFRHALGELKKSDQMQYVGSVSRRAAQLTDSPILARMFEQEDMGLNFRRVMDEGKSVIVNLHLQDLDAQALLGCLVTKGYEQAAFQRQHRERRHILMMDEFQIFTDKSAKAFETMLSQTRKYGLFFWCAHQNYGQLSEELQSSLQNVSLDVVMKLSAGDAQRAAMHIAEIDPRSISSETDAHARERTGIGMAEQREEWKQEIEGLWPGGAFIRHEFVRRHWIHRKLGGIVKLKTPPPRKPKVDARKVEEVATYYLMKFFRSPKVEIAQEPHRAVRSQTLE